MRESILVVDDNRDLRELAETILKSQDYHVILAVNGKEALEIFDRISPDLIISDVAMPKLDGFGLLKAVRSRENGAAVPFLFLSAYSQKSNLLEARRLAVDDYLFKPFDAQELLEAVRVRLDRRQAVQTFDTREAHLQTVLLMANAIEARDPYTRGHIDRVCHISMLFGKALGWSQTSLAVLEFGAILHDIGKIVVPVDILNKKGAFTPEEWKVMRRHPKVGAKMLEGVHHLKPVVPFILYHHERWDGSGYPYGLKGKDIPIEGRLMAITDVYDALTSDRSYHIGVSKEEALMRVKMSSGALFDPFLVEEFLKVDLPEI